MPSEPVSAAEFARRHVVLTREEHATVPGPYGLDYWPWLPTLLGLRERARAAGKRGVVAVKLSLIHI